MDIPKDIHTRPYAVSVQRRIDRDPEFLAALRREVAKGHNHDCSEWTKSGKCQLCDRAMPDAMTPLEPLNMVQVVNVMLYIRWRAEGRIPENPRIEAYLAGRPLRDDDGVFVRVPVPFKEPK